MQHLDGKFKATATTMAPFFKKNVTINVLREDGDDHDTVTGRIETISDTAVIIRTRAGSEVVTNARIVDLPVVLPPRRNSKVIVRTLRPLETTVRQHLVDRHGLVVDLANALTEDQAVAYHNRIDHGNLGHRHEETKGDE